MGTRSLTYVYDERDIKKALVCMYRQYDGQLESHGLELAKFLKPICIVNGIDDDTPMFAANGAGCLAAQLVAHFKTDNPKTEIGNIYLMPAENELDAGQDYTYRIYAGLEDQIEIAAFHHPWCAPDKELFRGTPKQFLDFITGKEKTYGTCA